MTERERGEVMGLLGAAMSMLAQAQNIIDTPEPTCPHPKDKQLDLTVMGGPPLHRCTQCGEESALPLSQPED